MTKGLLATVVLLCWLHVRLLFVVNASLIHTGVDNTDLQLR